MPPSIYLFNEYSNEYKFPFLFHFFQYQQNACLASLNKEYTENDLRASTKYIIVQDTSLDNNTLTYIPAKPFVSYDFAPTRGLIKGEIGT